jgi:carboxymethylenebutenolidase
LLITIDTANGPVPALEAPAVKAAKGGIIVVHEVFGLTAHIESIVGRLADAGWHAVAPDFFHRSATSVFAYDDLGSAIPVMNELTAEGIAADLSAAIDHLESVGFRNEHTCVLGFCMGGTIALFAGSRRRLGAAVTFYGGGVTKGRFGLPSLVDLAPQLQTPWLGLYGDLDQGIPIADVEELRRAAGTAAVPSEIVRYPDGDHGFNCDGRPDVFNPAAAADAWERAGDWVDRYGAAVTR